jgi:hypothetical protein
VNPREALTFRKYRADVPDGSTLVNGRLSAFCQGVAAKTR